MARTRPVERSRYRVYWNRATELRQMMRAAAERELWSAVGLNAVHCLIASADAVLVYRQQVRSAAEGHLEVVELLGRERELPEITTAVNHLRKGLARKNLVAYEDRELTSREAREVVEHAERFYAWAREVLPRPV